MSYGKCDMSWNEYQSDYPYCFTKDGKHIGDDPLKTQARI